MYKEKRLESTIATVKGYYASLPETVGKLIHIGSDEDIPDMESLMEDSDGITDSMQLLEQIINARGVMPSDYVLMATLYVARAIQVQEHLEECEGCQRHLSETIKRNDRLKVIRTNIKQLLGEEDDEENRD